MTKTPAPSLRDTIDEWWPEYLKKVTEYRRADLAADKFKPKLPLNFLRGLFVEEPKRREEVDEAIEAGQKDIADKMASTLEAGSSWQKACFKAMISLQEAEQLREKFPKLARAAGQREAEVKKRLDQSTITLYDGPDPVIAYRRRMIRSQKVSAISVHRPGCGRIPKLTTTSSYYWDTVRCTPEQAEQLIQEAKSVTPLVEVRTACTVCHGLRSPHVPTSHTNEIKHVVREHVAQTLRGSGGIAERVRIDEGVIELICVVRGQRYQVPIRVGSVTPLS